MKPPDGPGKWGELSLVQAWTPRTSSPRITAVPRSCSPQSNSSRPGRGRHRVQFWTGNRLIVLREHAGRMLVGNCANHEALKKNAPCVQGRISCGQECSSGSMGRSSETHVKSKQEHRAGSIDRGVPVLAWCLQFASGLHNRDNLLIH